MIGRPSATTRGITPSPAAMRGFRKRREAPAISAGSRSSGARLRSTQARGTRAASSGAPGRGRGAEQLVDEGVLGRAHLQRAEQRCAPSSAGGIVRPLCGELNTAQELRSAGILRE